MQVVVLDRVGSPRGVETGTELGESRRECPQPRRVLLVQGQLVREQLREPLGKPRRAPIGDAGGEVLGDMQNLVALELCVERQHGETGVELVPEGHERRPGVAE